MMLSRIKLTGLVFCLLTTCFPLHLSAEVQDTGFDARGDIDASGAADIRRSVVSWSAQSGLTVSIQTANHFEGGAAVEYWTAFNIGQEQRSNAIATGEINAEFHGFNSILITSSRVEQARSECGEVSVPVKLELSGVPGLSGSSAPVAVLKTLCASLATLDQETGKYKDVRVPTGYRYSVTLPPEQFENVGQINIRIRALQRIEPVAIDRIKDLSIFIGR